MAAGTAAPAAVAAPTGDMGVMMKELAKAADMYARLGAAHLKVGDCPGSLAMYKEALSLKPDNVDYREEIAKIHESRGELVEAIKEYATVLEMDSTRVEAKKALARLEVKGQQKSFLDELKI